MTAAKLLFPKRFEEFIYLPLNNKYFLVQGRDDSLSHGFNLLFISIQLLAMSLFIFIFLNEIGYNSKNSPGLFYIQICSLYAVFIGAKIFIEKIIGNIFNIENLINQYLYQKLTYRNYIGIFILVCNILLIYSFGTNRTVLLILLAATVAFNGIWLLFSYKNFRSILIPHFLYFILYLCALEIAPYMILYKAVT